MIADGTEDEIAQLIRSLRANVAYPRITDHIFYAKKPLTAEEIVDEALAYEPIRLPTEFSDQ